MMRVISVVLPPDAAKSEVADIEIASNASIYSLKEKILEVANFNFHLKTKDLTLLTGGRRLVDRACVSEIPELVDQPMVVVVATKIATSLTMRNDADPTFKWDVTMGLDCPIKVMTDEHQVHQVRGITRLAVTPETTPRMLKSQSKTFKLLLTP